MVASIPIFLCQEQVGLGEGYIKKPFVVRNDYLDLPDGPRLGIKLDEDALAGTTTARSSTGEDPVRTPTRVRS
jgi:L-alanine-DL-glutamate epimerase-like enolase superfamily enzyme